MSENTNPTGVDGGPIFSEMAGDEDMMELVQFFVDELQVRIEALSGALEKNDSAELRTLAHQLKGAAGGYGFPAISETAGVLEAHLMAAGADDLAALQARVADLIGICRRASA